MGGGLPAVHISSPPPAAGPSQALVELQQCMHCNHSVGSDDLAGICADCWEELEEESVFPLSVAAVRYHDYVLAQIKLKLKAKTKVTRLPLGPFSLEALQQLRQFILQKYEHQDLASEVELVQTKGARGGNDPKQWELRFSEPEVLDVVLGPAFIENEDLNYHMHVAGAGKLFGDVFTGFVSANFRLDASNRRGTKDTSLTFNAIAGSMSEHGFVWPLGRKQPRRSEYQNHLARQVLRINQARMKSNVAIQVAIAAGATNIVAPFPMLAQPFLRRAFLEAGIVSAAPAAAAAPMDAG